MTALEKRIAVILAEDIENLENTGKVLIYETDDALAKKIKDEKDAAKKEERAPKNIEIPENLKRGNVYVCIIDTPYQHLSVCFIYDKAPDKAYIFQQSISDRQMLMQLGKIGIPFLDSFRLKIAVEYERLCNSFKHVYAADKIGITIIGKKRGIALSEFISKGKLSPYIFLGHIQAKPDGNKDEYYTEINKWIQGKPKLQIFLALSIVGLISRIVRTDAERVVLFACGIQSCGKSTASLLPASAWCNYKYTEHKFGSTNVGLQDVMEELNFIPIIADEFLKSRGSGGKKLSGEIFDFYSSSRKTKYGNKEPMSNTAPFMSSAVSSLTELLYKADTTDSGDLTRFIEINVELGDLTDGAEHARRMRLFLDKNYGWLGLDVASHLVSNDYIIENSDNAKNLQDKFDMLMTSLSNEYRSFKGPKTPIYSIEERLLEKVALLVFSAKIINESTKDKLKMDINKMKQTLFESVKRQCNYGVINQEDILKSIKQFFMENQKEFCNYDNAEKEKFSKDSHMGLYSREKNRIWLRQNTLDKIKKIDWDSALSALRKSGALIVGKNDKHLSKQVMTDHVHRYRFYEINTATYEGDDFWCEEKK